MSLPATSIRVILDSVLNSLSPLFLPAVGNLDTARLAASEMLESYKVETPDELRLAAEIISFSFHALEALSQAAEPDLSLNKVLRLRGSAVSLSRMAHKSQDRLDQLQRARRAQPQPGDTLPHPVGIAPDTSSFTDLSPGPEPSAELPQIDAALDLAQTRLQAAQGPAGDATGHWPQSFHKREMARRMTETLKQSQARHLARTGQVGTASPDATQPATAIPQPSFAAASGGVPIARPAV